MRHTDHILPRQRWAFVLAAFSAPAVATAASLSWPWVLAVTLPAGALLVGLNRLQGFSGLAAAESVKKAWGKVPGAVLLALQLLFAAVLLWHLALGADAAFPDENTGPFVPLTLLAVCAWASWHGRAACVRAVGVLFFFLAALYLAIFAFALPQAEPARLLNWDMTPELLPLGVVLLLPFYGCYLTPRGESSEKFPGGWLTALLVLPAAAAAICTAVPGSGGRFYEMAKSVEVLSFAQRLEPLVSCAATVGWFAALTLVTLAAGELARPLGLPRRWGSLSVCMAAVPGVLLEHRLLPGFLLLSGAVFCVVLPLVTQGIVWRKKL